MNKNIEKEKLKKNNFDQFHSKFEQFPIAMNSQINGTKESRNCIIIKIKLHSHQW